VIDVWLSEWIGVDSKLCEWECINIEYVFYNNKIQDRKCK